MKISISINYKDLYSKGFHEFYAQYKKQAKDRNLYVNFTNHIDNTLDRSAYANPDHSDPSGTYAYPLSYVINYPGDIWYGTRAKYLRVLKATDIYHCLDVQNAFQVEGKCLNFINNIYNTSKETTEQFNLAKRWVKRNRDSPKALAKAVFACIQATFKLDDERRVVATQRSGPEQTRILLKMGYTSVEDTGSSHKSAIINDREPLQIIFLTPKAFKVLDYFTLGGGKPSSIVAQISDEELEHKLAALIFGELGDKLRSWDRHTFWSKAGRSANIQSLYLKDSHEGLRIGQKRHKASKKVNLKTITVKLVGEHGTIERTYYEETFEEIVDELTSAWLRQPIDGSWVPDSKELHKQRQEDAKTLASRQFRQKQVDEAVKDSAEITVRYNAIADHYSLPHIVLNNDPEILYQQMLLLKFVMGDFAGSIKELGIKKSFKEIAPALTDCKTYFRLTPKLTETELKQFYDFVYAIGTDFYQNARFGRPFDAFDNNTMSYGLYKYLGVIIDWIKRKVNVSKYIGTN